MKVGDKIYTMKTIYKTLKIAFVAILLSACTLGVQDNFDFKEEFPTENPHANITAWEFIQSQTTPGVLNDAGEKRLDVDNFDFLAAAIRHVGYEDLYNQPIKDRTYILLGNLAFLGGNTAETRVLPLILGRSFGAARDRVNNNPHLTSNFFNAEEIISEITEPQDINTLKAILRYHILGNFVEQTTLTIFEQNFTFNTLLPTVITDGNGDAVELSSQTNAIMQLRRLPNLNVSINGVDSNLIPVDSRIMNGTITKHNIVLKNGIAHSVRDMHRFQNYSLYSNLNVD